MIKTLPQTFSGLQCELGIPIKLVGLGEGPADLVEFDAVEFVDALFEE